MKRFNPINGPFFLEYLVAVQSQEIVWLGSLLGGWIHSGLRQLHAILPLLGNEWPAPLSALLFSDSCGASSPIHAPLASPS